MKLTLTAPVIITPRLMAGVRVEDALISIEYGRGTHDGRQGYTYYIDIGSQSYSGDDIASGCGGGSLQDGLRALIGFLSACGESENYRQRTGRAGENCDLFPHPVRGWAAQHSDALAVLSCELDENEGLIVEE